MEAVKPWQEVEAEAEAEKEDVAALRGRVPRHHITSTVTITTTTKDGSSSSSSSSSSSESSLSEDKSLKKEKVNGKSSNGISHQGNGDTKSPNDNYGFEYGVVADLPISKEDPVDQILEFEEANDTKFPLIEVASNHHHEIEIEKKGLPAFTPPTSQEQNGGHTSVNNGKTEINEAELRDKSIEELRELYLAKLLEKPGPHEFYCPNCKTCITKVLVRDREVEIRPSTPTHPVRRVEKTKCTSCFSFLLIPAAWFFPKWSMADSGEDDTHQGVPVTSDGLHEPQNAQNSQAAPTISPAHKPTSVDSASAITKPPENKSRDSTGLKLVLPSNKPEIISGQSKRTPVPEQPIPATITPATKPLSDDSHKEEQAPSKDSNELPHDKRPSLQGSFGVFFSGITKPWQSNFENGVNLKVPVPHDKIPTVPDYSSEVLNVKTKPSTSGIVETPSTPKPVQLPGPPEYGRPEVTILDLGSIQTPLVPEERSPKTWEIIKSIVYGGLTESITSLGIVTSAASGDASTRNIIGLALANLVGGLFIIGHNLWDLKDDKSKLPSNDTDTDEHVEHGDRYGELLGKRENFILHAFFAVLSFLVFGLVPPVVYGFTFRESNEKDLKLAAVAAASLVCIIILSFAKAYTQKPSKYIKTVTYYITVGLAVSGASYIAGQLINKLLEKLNWLEPTPPAPAAFLLGMGTKNFSWQSY